MPIVHIDLLEGRTQEQLSNMARKVTEAIVNTTGAKSESVHIVINEMKKQIMLSMGNYFLIHSNSAFINTKRFLIFAT